MALVGCGPDLRHQVDASVKRYAGFVCVVDLALPSLVLGPPKSRAGVRTVSLPDAVVPALPDHLSEHVGSASDALVFTADNGKPVWRSNFDKLADWRAAVAKAGAPGLRFRDLRRTGNTLAARTGASRADLMARMGTTPRRPR